MTKDLGTLLADIAQAESERYERHSNADTLLYERAIAPRRMWRRAGEAGAGVAMASAVAIGAFSLGAAGPDIHGPAVSPTPEPSATVELEPWKVQGFALDPHLVPQGPLGENLTGDMADTDTSACLALDALARFGIASDGVRQVMPNAVAPVAAEHLGGFAAEGTIGVYSAQFASAADAEQYLAHVADVARRCGEELPAEANVAVATDVALGTVPGTGTRIDVSVPSVDEGAWRAWLHATDAEVLAVVTEPQARGRASAVIVEYLTTVVDVSQ